jgi:hypothetical protein
MTTRSGSSLKKKTTAHVKAEHHVFPGPPTKSVYMSAEKLRKWFQDLEKNPLTTCWQPETKTVKERSLPGDASKLDGCAWLAGADDPCAKLCLYVQIRLADMPKVLQERFALQGPDAPPIERQLFQFFRDDEATSQNDMSNNMARNVDLAAAGSAQQHRGNPSGQVEAIVGWKAEHDYPTEVKEEEDWNLPDTTLAVMEDSGARRLPSVVSGSGVCALLPLQEAHALDVSSVHRLQRGLRAAMPDASRYL